MPLNGGKKWVLGVSGTLATALTIAVVGSTIAEFSSHASDGDLKHEEVERKKADDKLEKAIVKVTEAVTEHIRTDESAAAIILEKLEQIERRLPQ